MIDPRELRIGNYLLDWQKDVVTVRFIERRIACLHANKTLVPYEPEQLSPVFIHEGWFKKFGFIRQWDEVEGEIEEWKKDEFIYHDKDHLSFVNYLAPETAYGSSYLGNDNSTKVTVIERF